MALLESVRPLVDLDATVVDQLQHSARAEAASYKGGALYAAENPVVSDWTRLPANEGAFVACLDAHVVGYLHFRIERNTAKVVAVWVQPEARELGLGDALIEATVAHAVASGCTAIEGTALPGDRLTKNLYERAGITARKITVWRSLSDPASSVDASR